LILSSALACGFNMPIGLPDAPLAISPLSIIVVAIPNFANLNAIFAPAIPPPITTAV
jgi:hypothetical protein